MSRRRGGTRGASQQQPLLLRELVAGRECLVVGDQDAVVDLAEVHDARDVALADALHLQPKRLVIESRWVSTPLALAGELRARRLNS